MSITVGFIKRERFDYHRNVDRNTSTLPLDGRCGFIDHDGLSSTRRS